MKNPTLINPESTFLYFFLRYLCPVEIVCLYYRLLVLETMRQIVVGQFRKKNAFSGVRLEKELSYQLLKLSLKLSSELFAIQTYTVIFWL